MKNGECRKGEERRKAHKAMSDPLRADLSLCNTSLCTPPNLIPFKHSLILTLTKTLPKTQHSNTISIYATKPKILFVLLNLYHLIGSLVGHMSTVGYMQCDYTYITLLFHNLSVCFFACQVQILTEFKMFV